MTRTAPTMIAMATAMSGLTNGRRARRSETEGRRHVATSVDTFRRPRARGSVDVVNGYVQPAQHRGKEGGADHLAAARAEIHFHLECTQGGGAGSIDNREAEPDKNGQRKPLRQIEDNLQDVVERQNAMRVG
jgi:hypothetical protein